MHARSPTRKPPPAPGTMESAPRPAAADPKAPPVARLGLSGFKHLLADILSGAGISPDAVLGGTGVSEPASLKHEREAAHAHFGSGKPGEVSTMRSPQDHHVQVAPEPTPAPASAVPVDATSIPDAGSLLSLDGQQAEIVLAAAAAVKSAGPGAPLVTVPVSLLEKLLSALAAPEAAAAKAASASAPAASAAAAGSGDRDNSGAAERALAKAEELLARIKSEGQHERQHAAAASVPHHHDTDFPGGAARHSSEPDTACFEQHALQRGMSRSPPPPPPSANKHLRHRAGGTFGTAPARTTKPVAAVQPAPVTSGASGLGRQQRGSLNYASAVAESTPARARPAGADRFANVKSHYSRHASPPPARRAPSSEQQAPSARPHVVPGIVAAEPQPLKRDGGGGVGAGVRRGRTLSPSSAPRSSDRSRGASTSRREQATPAKRTLIPPPLAPPTAPGAAAPSARTRHAQEDISGGGIDGVRRLLDQLVQLKSQADARAQQPRQLQHPPQHQQPHQQNVQQQQLPEPPVEFAPSPLPSQRTRPLGQQQQPPPTEAEDVRVAPPAAADTNAHASSAVPIVPIAPTASLQPASLASFVPGLAGVQGTAAAQLSAALLLVQPARKPSDASTGQAAVAAAAAAAASAPAAPLPPKAAVPASASLPPPSLPHPAPLSLTRPVPPAAARLATFVTPLVAPHPGTSAASAHNTALDVAVSSGVQDARSSSTVVPPAEAAAHRELMARLARLAFSGHAGAPGDNTAVDTGTGRQDGAGPPAVPVEPLEAVLRASPPDNRASANDAAAAAGTPASPLPPTRAVRPAATGSRTWVAKPPPIHIGLSARGAAAAAATTVSPHLPEAAAAAPASPPATEEAAGAEKGRTSAAATPLPRPVLASVDPTQRPSILQQQLRQGRGRGPLLHGRTPLNSPLVRAGRPTQPLEQTAHTGSASPPPPSRQPTARSASPSLGRSPESPGRGFVLSPITSGSGSGGLSTTPPGGMESSISSGPATALPVSIQRSTGESMVAYVERMRYARAAAAAAAAVAAGSERDYSPPQRSPGGGRSSRAAIPVPMPPSSPLFKSRSASAAAPPRSWAVVIPAPAPTAAPPATPPTPAMPPVRQPYVFGRLGSATTRYNTVAAPPPSATGLQPAAPPPVQQENVSEEEGGGDSVQQAVAEAEGPEQRVEELEPDAATLFLLEHARSVAASGANFLAPAYAARAAPLTSSQVPYQLRDALTSAPATHHPPPRAIVLDATPRSVGPAGLLAYDVTLGALPVLPVTNSAAYVTPAHLYASAPPRAAGALAAAAATVASPPPHPFFAPPLAGLPVGTAAQAEPEDGAAAATPPTQPASSARFASAVFSPPPPGGLALYDQLQAPGSPAGSAAAASVAHLVSPHTASTGSGTTSSSTPLHRPAPPTTAPPAATPSRPPSLLGIAASGPRAAVPPLAPRPTPAATPAAAPRVLT